MIFMGLALSLICATSCQKFLTVVPDDNLTFDNYYTSDASVNAATRTLYTMFVWQDFGTSFQWMAGDELAGDLFYTYDQEGQFYYMTFNNGNKFLTQGWNGLYRVISYCNNILNDMPEAARTNGVSEGAITRALAEARCIRGIAHFLLTEYWRDVPVITNNNINNNEVYRYKQSSVYEFIRRDLVFAMENLSATTWEAGRCTQWTAKGMLAKLHLTMASHLNDANSAANFTAAKNYAEDVIKNSGLSLYSNLSDMFYPSGNNNVESLFAMQCTNDGYGYGNLHSAHLTRNALLNNGAAYGAGKGPTLSLQEAFEDGDLRRPLTFMRNGDHYNNLGGGGYTYVNYSEDKSTEMPNEMLAHVRKYLVGTNEDCGGKAGSNQDAGNNLYILRLTDVYLCYVEACIGAGVSTTDALAVDVFNQVRLRANLNTVSEITYPALIKERRCEFAFEGNNFFDIKRMSYRNMQDALTYINGMHRERQYITNGNSSIKLEDYNAADMYHGGFNPVLPDTITQETGTPFYYNENAMQINFVENSLTLPIPASTVTKTPNIMQEAKDYEF
jgi:hypothetical protein